MTIAQGGRTASPVALMQVRFGTLAFKTLAAAHELGLFARLSGTAGSTVGELSQALGMQDRPAQMLLTGRNYTAAEYSAWLAELGFADVHTVWFEAAGANGAVIGRKP